MHAAEMASCGMIYTLSFMMIRRGAQTILGFCLRNMRGCEVCITDRMELSSALFRPALVACYI
jgi:hypothetical protein